MGTWIFGAVIVVLGLAGLIVAGHAHDSSMHMVGLGLFVLAVIVVFGMILRATGTPRHAARNDH